MGAYQNAVDILRGQGRYDRLTSYEPTLLPIVAGDLAPDRRGYGAYVANLTARNDPYYGWPLLGAAAAQALAPGYKPSPADIDILPDLLLFLPAEDAERLVGDSDEPRWLLRLAARPDRLRPLDVIADPLGLVEWYWWGDWVAVALVLEAMNTGQRREVVPALLDRVAHTDPTTRLVQLSLIAPYADDSQATAREALGLLVEQAQASGWYATLLAAHLGYYARMDSLPDVDAWLDEPWRDHFTELLAQPREHDPGDVAAASHPFGDELRGLLGQLDPRERAEVAADVTDGIVHEWGGAGPPETTGAEPPDETVITGRGVSQLDVHVERPGAAPPDTTGAGAEPPDETVEWGGGRPTAEPSVERVAPEHADVETNGGNHASSRSMRVDVILPDGPGGEIRLERSFVAGQRHRVSVWIGHARDARTTTISSTEPIDEDAVHTDLGSFTELDVTLAHGRSTDSRKLYLPTDRARSSQPCDFDVRVAPAQAIVSATIVVSQNGRTIHQSVLLGRVGVTPDEVADASIELETQVQARSHEQPGLPSGFDATVVRPRGDAPHVLLKDGTAEVVVPWEEGLRTTIDVVAERLFNTARAMVAGDDKENWHELVRLLAAQGTVLHSWLKNNGYGDLDGAQRIQLTDADPTEPLAIELVYDRGSAADDATPCQGWSTALACGVCQNCEPATTRRSETICPLGFWGLSKVVERQTGTGPTPPPGRLRPLASVLFAASGEGVRDTDYESTVAALTAVLREEPTAAESWEQWTELAKEHKPTLIVILPHQDRDARLAVDFLEIGRTSRLRAGEVTTEFIKPSPDGPDPIVLLLGCKTANASISYQNFVAEFRSNGAAIVVGTLSTILGQHAAPIAQQFVRELAATRSAADGATQEAGFGEVMRTVRRRMVDGGNAAALGLIAFGDSDWTVAGGR